MNRRTPNKTETTLAFVASVTPSVVMTLAPILVKRALPIPVQLALMVGRAVYTGYAPRVFAIVANRLADRRNRVDQVVEEAQNILAEIAGLDAATSGRITIGERPVTGLMSSRPVARTWR